MSAGDDRLVLNVEDTEASRYAKSRSLKRAGYRVIEAVTGGEALRLVAAERPDLVMLDIRLPDMSGLEVCRIIKEQFPNTLVLQVSASLVGAQARVTGLEGGADSYLSEPATPEELVAAVRALLRMKAAEDQLRAANDLLERRVAERTAELAAANERLRGEIAQREEAEAKLRYAYKMEAIGQLTGGMAHDFNNLLTIVIGYLDRLTRIIPESDARARRAIGNARLGASRAAMLVARLLAFSRRQPLNPKPLNLNALVGGMQELLRQTLGETWPLELRLGARLGNAVVDPNQMENALLNLVINARDASPSGSAIAIETGNQTLTSPRPELPAGDYVVLAVRDRGSGMPSAVVQRAFDPFFTTKPIGQGTGLGLSMVYGFMKQSGGHVEICSAPGEGTEVRLYLPAIETAEPARPAPRQATEPALPRGDALVLVVEDDAGVREYCRETLEEHGFRVVTAADGPEALRVLESDPAIAAVFSDVVLKGELNGIELAERIQAWRRNLPVLLTTGYAGPHGQSRDLPPGLPIIAKPYSAADLANRLARLLVRADAEA